MHVGLSSHPKARDGKQLNATLSVDYTQNALAACAKVHHTAGPSRPDDQRNALSLLDALDGQREDRLHRGSAAINVQQLAGDEARLVSTEKLG